MVTLQAVAPLSVEVASHSIVILEGESLDLQLGTFVCVGFVFRVCLDLNFFELWLQEPGGEVFSTPSTTTIERSCRHRVSFNR